MNVTVSGNIGSVKSTTIKRSRVHDKSPAPISTLWKIGHSNDMPLVQEILENGFAAAKLFLW